LHPEQYKDGAAMQALQGLVAFQSGGWFGLGLGSSRQKMGWLPFHKTDFIFPIIGEELGLAATLFVVLAFTLMTICGLFIALRARDLFGRLLGTASSPACCPTKACLCRSSVTGDRTCS
jgi:cell division protein FtsW